jgi:hypothetical protein
MLADPFVCLLNDVGRWLSVVGVGVGHPVLLVKAFMGFVVIVLARSNLKTLSVVQLRDWR